MERIKLWHIVVTLMILLGNTFWNVAAGYIKTTEKTTNFGSQIVQLSEKLETFNILVYRLETAEKIINNHEDDIKLLRLTLMESVTALNTTLEAVLKQLDRLERTK